MMFFHQLYILVCLEARENSWFVCVHACVHTYCGERVDGLEVI